MLCEIATWGNFLETWVVLSLLSMVLTLSMSGVLFVKYYVNPTFEQWRYKSNPKYPSAAKVRDEVLQMLKGLWTATLCPAGALYMAKTGMSQSFCGSGGYDWTYHFFTFLVVVIGSDFFEFLYHYCGHRFSVMWNVHKWHHVFFNPSPFAVIADEYIDQGVRASPLLILPMVMPINIDLMFFTYGAFFYAYGTYLHLGYETDWPDPHHPWINTSFQHYLHHAVSIKNRPYHCGFFIKLWDQMFGSIYTGKCFCAKCGRENGSRSLEAFNAVEKPDYSPLLAPSFWWNGPDKIEKVKAKAR